MMPNLEESFLTMKSLKQTKNKSWLFDDKTPRILKNGKEKHTLVLGFSFDEVPVLPYVVEKRNEQRRCFYWPEAASKYQWLRRQDL